MGHPSRRLEDKSAESNVDYRYPNENVLQGNNVINWAKDHSFDIFAKNVATFCPCFKCLLGTKLKYIVLISLTLETSKQSNIDFVTWLLVVTDMQVYNETKPIGKMKYKCTI